MGKIHKLLHKFLTVCWKISFPTTVGVRCIVTNDQDKILLVKHSYGNSWFLPGGGLKKREKFEDGIKRELKEEIRLTIEKLELFGVYNNFYEKNDTIILFKAYSGSKPEISSKEIEQAGFFDLNDLPDNISPGTRRRLEELQKDKRPYCSMW